MVRVLVIEDEPHAMRHLVKMLAELPGIQVVGEASNGFEGLAKITELRPDAVFLDVRMPGMDGIELMRQMPEPRPALVFTTAHKDHAIDAFDGGAVHYLLKPISRVRVAQAISRIQPRLDPLQKEWLRIPIRMKGQQRFLRPEEVDAVVADLGDCLAWTREGTLRVEGTLANWEERLVDYGFTRVHRNALVRLEAVQGLSEADELILPGGRLAIAKRRVDDIQRMLGM